MYELQNMIENRDFKLVFGTPDLLILSKADGAGSQLVIAGYASVQIRDVEKHLITTNGLSKAMRKFMDQPEFSNVMLEHTNLQIGTVVESFEAADGQTYTTHVDDVGLFVVVKIRDEENLTIMKEVRSKILDGSLHSFSIAGQALNPVIKYDDRGQYIFIDNLELFEITICERGKNPSAIFGILSKAMSDSGVVTGPSVSLSQILPFYAQPIVLANEFVSLVGGIAVKGQSTNDIDILIRKSREEWADVPIRFRLVRAVTDPDLQKRVSVLYDEFHGPFTDYVPLYDLVLVPTQRSGEIVKLAQAGLRFRPTSQSRLVTKARGIIEEHFNYQLALARAAIKNSPNSNVMSTRLVAAVDRGWDGIDDELRSQVILPAMGLGGTLLSMSKLTVDNPLSKSFDIERRPDQEVLRSTSIFKLLDKIWTDFNRVKDTTLSIITQAVADAVGRGSIEDADLDLAELFGSWMGGGLSPGRIGRLASDLVSSSVNGGTLVKASMVGHDFVIVIDNEMPTSCAICAEVNGQVWPIDQAMYALKEHPGCVREFAPYE